MRCRTVLTGQMIALCLLLSLACSGCRGLIGVRATVLDEPTILEWQVLGERAVLDRGAVLLPLSAPTPVDREELLALDAAYARQMERLAAVKPQTEQTRTWQAVILYSRGVLRSRLGEQEEAAKLLEQVERHCRAFHLDVLRWQALQTLGDLRGGEPGYALHLQAVQALEDTLPLTRFEHDLENPERRDALYASLIRASLTKKDPEAAFALALRRRAMALARASATGEVTFQPGPLADLAAELTRAQEDVARAREELCTFPAETLLAGGTEDFALEAARKRMGEARASLSAVRERLLREHPAAAGLAVPAPADVFQVQELLWPDTALLVLEPLGASEYAGFMVRSDGFAAGRFELPQEVLKGETEEARQKLSTIVFGPFLKQMGGPVRRLYLAPSGPLMNVSWHAVPVLDKPLAERFQVAFVEDPADLAIACAHRGYGREAFVLARGAAKGLGEVGSQLLPQGGVTALNAARAGRADLVTAMAYPDFVWLSNPVVLDMTAPARSYISVPSALGRIGGMDVGSLCALRSRASCVCLASVGEGGWSEGSELGLRMLLRALGEGGVPTVICGAGAAPPEVSRAFWDECLERLRALPAGEAYRLALAKVPAEWRGRFRLYGFLGMDEAEYAQHSKLEFNDRFRASQKDMKAGRLAEAAAQLLSLWHMKRAQESSKPDEKLWDLAVLQNHLIECWAGLRDYDRAAQHQELRIGYLKQLSKYPPVALGIEYQSLGAWLTRAERFDRAVKAYRQSIDVLTSGGGKEEDIAAVLGELGKSFDRAAQYEEAIGSFEAALKKYEQLKDESGVALQLRRMGALSLRRLNLAQRAQQQFEEALKLYEAQLKAAGQQGQPARQDVEGFIETTIDLGLCRRHLGDFDGAIARFEAALKAARDSGLPALQAQALSEIAGTRWFQGKYQDAFLLVTESNEIAERLKDAFQLNVNYQLVGLIHWELNDYERALEALDKAEAYAREAEQPLEVASACNNRGIVLRRQEKYPEALDSFHRAMEIDERLGSRWGLAYDHRNIGITLGLMKRYDEAGRHLDEAVRLAEEIEDAVNLAKALYHLGELRLAEGRRDEAAPLLERSLQAARKVYLPEVEWRALRALGVIQREKGDQAKALELLKQAVDVVEGLRGELKTEEFRSGFLTNKMDLYEDLVALLLDMNKPEDAFEYAERSRARNFLDILAGQSFELRSDRERELYAQQQKLAREMRSLREAAGAETDAQARAALVSRVEELRKQYTELLLLIRAANPALSSFVTVEVVKPEDLARLIGPNEALVVYYVMEHETAIWVVRDGKLHLRRAKIERSHLSEDIRNYRVMVQGRELLEKVKAASADLYGKLVAPVADLLEGSRVVGIVPHRALHYLSFAGLYDGREFMVERYPLFYAPSASVLPLALKEPQAKEPGKTLKVLAVGNPEVGDPAYALPFSEKEVASLSRDFVDVTSLVGERATETWVEQHISEFDVIHFATHGYFNSVNPLFSGLVLAPDEAAGTDGLLELHEVSGLPIKARLVTLSACQSGVGELKSADELVSLSRAFMYAGTRSILSTLWRVDDVSTALLAKHFYRRYAGHVRAGADEREGDAGRAGMAESLRYAQLQVMNDGRHYHPMYWAGMVLTGDYR